MNPLLHLFYQFLKFMVVRPSLWLFHSKIEIIGKENLNHEGPLIIISNHPNTLLDPLEIACRLRVNTFFLANYSLFKNPIMGAILNTLYCIPIKRPQDLKEGQPLKNDEAFARCDEHLSKGGSIYIAPEGTSFMERHLREFRSGTARIAFSAEQANEWKLDLRILPIGLTYYKPNEYHSKLVMNVGNPIQITQFKEAFQQNPKETVRELTCMLEQKVSDLMIDCIDTAHEKTLEVLETIVKNDKKLNLAQLYTKGKALEERLELLSINDETAYNDLQNDAATYKKLLRANKLVDEAIANRHQNTFAQTVLHAFIAIIGLPFFLYGYISNFFGFLLPNLAAKIANPYIGYYSAFKYGLGLITVPLFYYLQYRLVANNLDNYPYFWLLLLSFPLFGYFALWYMRLMRNWWSRMKLLSYQADHPENYDAIINLRKKIMGWI